MGKVIVQCGIQIDNEYWFAAGNTNGLFKKNMLTGELHFVGFFLDEMKTQFRTYTDVKLIGNQLIFTPCFAKGIAVYNLDEKKFSNIILSNYEGGINQYTKSVKYNDHVYFIPYSTSFFIKYCVSEGEIKKLDGWGDLKKQYPDQKKSNFIIESICTDDNNIYMFMSDRSQAIILDMDTDKFQVVGLNISLGECICSVCKSDSRIWIVTDKNKVYQWDYTNNEVLRTFDLGQYITDLDYIAHYIYVVGKYVYIINVYDKNIRLFDYINNKFSTIDMSEYVEDKKDNDPSLYYYYDIQCIENNKIRLFSFYDGKYITIDGKEATNSFDGFSIPNVYFENCFTDKFFLEGSTLRYVASSILEEIEIVLTQNTFEHDDEGYSEKNIGEIIYDTLTRSEM